MASRLFGRKKAKAPEGPKVSLGDAIGKSDGRVAALDEKIAKLNAELRGYQAQLKKIKSPAAQRGIKQRAVQALKRKKMYEQQRDSLMATSFNMEQTNFALESIKDTHTTIAAMKTAAEQLKVEHKAIDIDSVEDMQDDIADLMADSEELNELMGRSFGVTEDIDEADLEDELAGLEDEWEADGEETADFSTVPASMPALPATGEPASAEAVAAPVAPTGAVEGVPTDEFGMPMAPVHAT